MTETAAGADARRIIVLPNRSLTDRQACGFVAFVATASLLVAGGFTVLGFWPILPFAGLEIALLTVALRVCRRDAVTESISVTDHDVIVESGPYSAGRYNRHWAAVKLHAPEASRPGRVTIGVHGKRHEIGAALTDKARSRLWKYLYTLVGPAATSPDLNRTGLKLGQTTRISNVMEQDTYREQL